MEFLAALFLCFVAFVVLLCPAVFLALLLMLQRRQKEMNSQLDDVQDGLVRLNRFLRERTDTVSTPSAPEKKNNESEPVPRSGSAALSSSIPCSKDTGPAVATVGTAEITGAEEKAVGKPPVSASPPLPPVTLPAAVPPSASADHLKSTAVDGAPPKADEIELEEESLSLLNRLWNWFVFGSDRLPEGVTLEYAIATHWLLRIGILISVLCVGFFLKYSLDKNWIGDTGRCLLSVVIGLVMIGVGLKLRGKRYNLPGMGLLGGGLVVLYWSVYAATVMYGILAQGWALPVMILITVCAGGLAVCLHSPLVAIIGIIGGYGSPILMSLQQADVFAILVYMLILGGGILGISFWRNWHLLNYLGFVFTYGITLSLQRHFSADNFSRVFPILVLYFVLYAAAMYIHNFLRGKKSTLIEMAGQVFNSLFFFLMARGLICTIYSKEWAAVLSLGLALFFFIHALMLIRSVREDKGLEVTLIGLSVFFLTISMPILLSSHWLTAAWALQALIMLWGAGKLNSKFLRSLAYGLYGLTFMRILLIDLHREFDWWRPQGSQQYWQDFKGRVFVFLAPAFSLFGGYWIQKPPLGPKRENSKDDILPSLPFSMRFFFWSAVLFTFFILNLEFNEVFLSFYAAGRPPGITLLWVMFCGYLVWRTSKGNSQVALPLLIIFGMGLIFKLVFFDLTSWDFDPDLFVCDSGYDFVEASMRGLDFILILGLLFGSFFLLPKGRAEGTRGMKTTFGYLGIVVLFLYLSLELNTALTVFKEGARAGAISILWSVFAISFLLTGLKKNQRVLRYIGLILFSVTIVKVFISDLAQLDPLYRIIAFGILGIVVTGGAFAYLFFRQSIEDKV